MLKRFSPKQRTALSWWHPRSPHFHRDAIICDGAVRSGKTFCMSLSFVLWAVRFRGSGDFALCGKTIRSLRRNMITPLLPLLRSCGFTCEEKLSQNLLTVALHGAAIRIHLFGGKDEASAALIQGMTLSGVLFDEAALMPRSFVEQALARCSVPDSRFWFNCNPEYPEHWFYTEWILRAEEKNALYLHFTMDDNPSLTPAIRRRYESLYTGAFYERFVRGRWVAVQGAVYPFMADGRMYCDAPQGECERYAISCDYGTVNPASFGLWGRQNGVWYRLDEYYFDSRAEGFQKTDEEHYEALCALAGERRIAQVTVDPSAASFIELIRRKGRFSVVPAHNNVVDGIRRVSRALKNGSVRICKGCRASRREFSLYRWSGKGSDTPVKEHDHAMDDIRYFVTTLTDTGGGVVVMAAERER